MYPKFLLIFLIVLLPLELFSQVIKGIISDDDFGPKAGVIVQINDSIQTETDSLGRYSINAKLGKNILKVWMPQFPKDTITVYIDNKDTVTLNYSTILEPHVVCIYNTYVLTMSPVIFMQNMIIQDGIFFFNNNYLIYNKTIYNDEFSTGFLFQPEYDKRLFSHFNIDAMCELYVGYAPKHNVYVKPHFRIKYYYKHWNIKAGYLKAIEKQDMPEQLYGLHHYYCSEINDGVSVTFTKNNYFDKSVFWVDCIDNNIFNNKWNKDMLFGLNLNKNFRRLPMRFIRLYADILFTNHSYISDKNTLFARNLESGFYGIGFNILNYQPVYVESYRSSEPPVTKLDPDKWTSIYYEIKYAQSHFFDKDAILNHKSGNGILNNLNIMVKRSMLINIGHFYAKNYVSTYSNQIFNCYTTDKPKLSVFSLGISYQKWFYGNFYLGISAHARFYQDIINNHFSYSVGANILLIPTIRF